MRPVVTAFAAVSAEATRNLAKTAGADKQATMNFVRLTYSSFKV